MTIRQNLQKALGFAPSRYFAFVSLNLFTSSAMNRHQAANSWGASSQQQFSYFR